METKTKPQGNNLYTIKRGNVQNTDKKLTKYNMNKHTKKLHFFNTALLYANP